jgi:hypothetical protein
MFTIKCDTSNNNNYDFNNCIFSTNISRPSKSLIDCDLYKEYSKINTNLHILDEFSYINSQSKKCEYFLMKEIINIFRLNILNNDTFSISFDSIIINEINNESNNESTSKNTNESFNIIFCFDTDISIRNTVINLSLLIKELQNNDSILINYDNLFTFPSAELLVIISNLFQKVKIYYCKLLKQNILYCFNYRQNQYITVLIKNIIRNWNKNSNIRQFGIFIDKFILDKIKFHNNYIFDYYININQNFANSTLEEKEYLFKNYVKKHCSTIQNCFNCNHDLKEFNLLNCMICCKCYDLFMIY